MYVDMGVSLSGQLQLQIVWTYRAQIFCITSSSSSKMDVTWIISLQLLDIWYVQLKEQGEHDRKIVVY